MADTLAGYMFWQFTYLQYAEFALRIVAAAFCGACIGFERSKRMKEAGIRTHIIVCTAASLMMIVSKYGFVDLTNAAGVLYNGARGADSARIAAAVVTGVGFLGAGMIFRNGSTVKGLTTAAGIWATAGIGLALGAGMYVIGGFATLFIALLQIITHRFVFGADALLSYRISFTVRSSEPLHEKLLKVVEEKDISISDSRIIYHDDGFVTYEVAMKTRYQMTGEKLRTYLLQNAELRAVSCTVIG